VGKDNYQTSIWLQGLMAGLKGAEHAVFIVGFGFMPITIKTAGFIDQFSVIAFVVPFGRKRLLEYGINIG